MIASYGSKTEIEAKEFNQLGVKIEAEDREDGK